MRRGNHICVQTLARPRPIHPTILYGLLAILITLALCMHTVFAGDLFDTAVAVPPGTYPGASGNMYSSTGTAASGWSQSTIEMDSGNTLFIGKNANADNPGLTMTLGGLTLDGANAEIVRPGDGVTNMTISTLTFGPGGGNIKIENGRSATQKNVLKFGQLVGGTAGPITIDVEGNASLQYTGSQRLTVGSTTDPFTLNLGVDSSIYEGQASFGRGLTVVNGSVNAGAGGGRLAVGSGAGALTINQGGLSADTGKLDITTGLTGTGYANVVLGGAGPVAVDIFNGAAIAMNDLTIDTGTTTINGTGTRNALNVNGKLTVEGTLTDSADVATTVKGATVVDGGTYTVAGTNNVYTGGVEVTNGGILTSDGNETAITVGASGGGQIELSGGTLASGGDVFTVNAREVLISDGGVALDASLGEIDLSKTAVRVNASGGVVQILADRGISVASYNQTAGDVEVSGGPERFSVIGSATIGGSSTTSFSVTGDAAEFLTGVIVSNNGVIAAHGGGGIVTLGGGRTTAVMQLTGKATLDGTGDTLTIAEGGRNSSIVFTGYDNQALGDIDASQVNALVNSNDVLKPALTIAQSGMEGLHSKNFTVVNGEAVIGANGLLSTDENVIVRGGMLASEDDSARITSSTFGGTNKVIVQRGGTLSTRHGDLTIAGYSGVEIAGQFLAGVSGSGPAVLYSDSDVTLARTASVGLTDEMALIAQTGDVLMQTTGGATIRNYANLTDYSMFGLFGFKVQNNNELVIESAKNKISGDYSPEDILRALGNLRAIWGHGQIGKDLGEIIYNASVKDPYTGEYGIIADPEDSIPGNKNIDIFQALASPRGKSVGRDTLEFVNGAHNFGVAEVAISTTSSMLKNVNQWLRAVNQQLMAAQEVESSEALATQILNNLYSARFWIGGFANWDNVDGRDDFSGHSYDSTGFVMGYDQAINCNTVVGGAFGYTKGDYEDKGAVANDSEITSYSFSGYGTYSLPFGFWVGGALAFTHSKNEIRGLRHDPSVGGTSWTEADFNGTTYAAGATIGWDYRPTPCFALMPSVGINYLYHTMNDHDSRFGGIVTQRESDLDHDALLLPVEIRGYYDMLRGDKCVVRFEANAGYTYNFDTDPMDGTILYKGVIWNNSGAAVASSLRSRESEKHTYNLGAGVRYFYEKFDVGVKYDFVASTNRTFHNILASAAVVF